MSFGTFHRHLLYLRRRNKKTKMNIIRQPHKIEQPIVATIGMFDGVHLGHRSLIAHVQQIARERGMKTGVITFATHPREVLHPEITMPLLTGYDERMAHLEHTGIDNAIVLDFSSELAQKSAREFITLLHDHYNVTILCVGYDHRFGHNRSEGFADYCKHGRAIGVEIIEAKPFIITEGTISSSAVRRALNANDIATANAMLGYNYTIKGTVVDGHKIGRTIGFPTANITPIDHHKLLPAKGVYAIRAHLDDKSTYNGMLNIGQRPTLSGDSTLTIEANLFDFASDLYGQDISIEFISFLRHEIRFNTLDDLKNALHNDAMKAREILARH